MKEYKKYKIGDVVAVENTVASVLRKNIRSVIPCKYDVNLIAWYVGYTYLQEGPITHSYGSYEDYEPGGIRVEKTILVARLRRYSRGREEYALFSDISKIDCMNPDEIHDYNGVRSWKAATSEENWNKYILELSKAANNAKRDAQGRFVSELPLLVE